MTLGGEPRCHSSRAWGKLLSYERALEQRNKHVWGEQIIDIS
jgi:hypothetical protein